MLIFAPYGKNKTTEMFTDSTDRKEFSLQLIDPR